MTSPLIDLDVAHRYLTALTGEVDPAVTWQTFDDDKVNKRDPDPLACVRHGRLSKISQVLLNLNVKGIELDDGLVHRAGVFISVNEMDGGGRKDENCIGLRALFIDQDGGSEVPTDWRLQPSIVVRRDATHWHAYWLLQPGEDLARFSAAQTHLACHFLSDLKIKDLPRVLRVPGFQHNKAAPLAVELLHVAPPEVPLWSIDEVLACHPVAFEQLDDKYHRGAVLVGLCPERPSAAPARAPAARPASSTEAQRQDEAFRKWASKKDTRGGQANDNGQGNDTAAFTIACEGFGRLQAGFISSESLIYEVVTDFCSRCGWKNVDSEVDRLCRSARSKPRQHCAVALPTRSTSPASSSSAPPAAARLAAPPMAHEDLFAGAAGAGKPPVPPASVPTPPAPDEEPWANLDLAGLGRRWSLTTNGVSPVELDAEGRHVTRINKRVAGLPIWPVCAGTDVASGATWWKLGWMTPYRTVEYQWLSEFDVKQGHALVSLPNAPVAKRQAENCAVYLTEARASVRSERLEVTSRIGWCGVNGGRRWVFPGVGQDQKVEYIGGALPAHGKLEGWLVGLKHLVDLADDDGFTALTVVCLSAAAPWSRLMGSRNPIIGLMGPSSSGKGSTIDYALAMWADLDLMRLPASSTSKGIEDKAIQLPDLPIFVDELQQLGELHPQATGNVLYFLANGQRRTTSSKSQVAVGGERRYGVGFYAAEAPVLPGQNLGVLFRVIELEGRPCPDEATAKALQEGAQHTGTVAGPIAALLGKRTAAEWVEQLRARAKVMRKDHPGLVGDDPEALAVLEVGIDALREISGLDVPKEPLLLWLAAKIRRQRTSVMDRETQCLHQVMAKVLNQNWFEEGDKPDDGPRKRNVMNVQGQPMAWRVYTPLGTTKHLDIEPLHRDLAPLFEASGGEERVLRHWADHGWIVRQENRLRVKRAGGGRAVRFTNDAWNEITRGTVEPQETTVT